jgi:hypothetical protein
MTIQEFPLAWRWTQAAHTILPADVLAAIRPLRQQEAAKIHERSSRQRDGATVSSPANDAAQNWLRSIQPDLSAPVIVCWSKDLAVETSWEIFTEYWDDFCYPSSDDISVIPVEGGWRLAYHHEEQFDFIR